MKDFEDFILVDGALSIGDNFVHDGNKMLEKARDGLEGQRVLQLGQPFFGGHKFGSHVVTSHHSTRVGKSLGVHSTDSAGQIGVVFAAGVVTVSLVALFLGLLEGERCQSSERILSSDQGIHQMGVSVVLILDDVVEDLQQESQVPVGILSRIQKLGRRKQLKQVDKLDSCHQRHGSPVGRNIADDGQEARVQRHQLVGTIDHQLVQGNGQQVVVATTEQGKIRWELLGEGLVEGNPKAALPTQLEQTERTNVDETDLGGIPSRFVHEVTNRNDKVVDVAFCQCVVHEQWIFLKEFPQQDQQFLEALELGRGIGKVCRLRLVAVLEKTRKSLKDKVELGSRIHAGHQVAENIESTAAGNFKLDHGFSLGVKDWLGVSGQSAIQKDTKDLGGQLHELNVRIRKANVAGVKGQDRVQQRVKEADGIGGIGSGGNRQPSRGNRIVFVGGAKEGIATGGQQQSQNLDSVLVVFARVGGIVNSGEVLGLDTTSGSPNNRRGSRDERNSSFDSLCLVQSLDTGSQFPVFLGVAAAETQCGISAVVAVDLVFVKVAGELWQKEHVHGGMDHQKCERFLFVLNIFSAGVIGSVGISSREFGSNHEANFFVVIQIVAVGSPAQLFDLFVGIAQITYIINIKTKSR